MENKIDLGPTDPKKTLDRRTVLKASIATFTGTILAGKEVKIGHKGVETSSGIFIPLYEQHLATVQKKDIPKDLYGFFRELAHDNLTHGYKPEQILSPEAKVRAGIGLVPVKLFRPEVLETLARNKTKVIFGDTYIPPITEQASGALRVVEGSVGGLLGIRAYLDSQNEKRDQSLRAQKPNKYRFSRRTFVKGAMYGASAWAVSPLTIIPNTAATVLLDQQNAIRRIVHRIDGLLSNLHPEQVTIFFRNALMADKMLVTGQAIQKEKGKKAKIAFNVGGAHSGIEDFLRVGPEACRFIIMAYPEAFLQSVVDINGSVENFCSIRLIELPIDFIVEDLKNLDKIAKIKDKRIYDEELLKQLNKKLRTSQPAQK